jgi:hypothetical protein
MFSSYSDGLILPVSQPEYHFIGLLEAGSGYVYAFDPFVGSFPVSAKVQFLLGWLRVCL